jgi:6-phosphogluconolactonase
MLQEALLRAVSIEDARVHRIQGELSPDAAARLYVEDIHRAFQISQTSDLPAFDVIQRGMGPDAHTASLFPNEPIIEDRTGIAAAVENPRLEESMRHRVTLLRGVLEHARNTLCLATGEDKAEALRKVLTTPFDPLRLPAQIASDKMVWFIDKAAAARL